MNGAQGGVPGSGVKVGIDVLEEDDLLREGPAAVAECVQQFMLVKELLTAPMLGTS